MRLAKDLFAITLIIGITLGIVNIPGYYGKSIQIAIAAISISFTSINLILRKHIVFKSYFTSNLNILTSKKKSTLELDFDSELVFGKILEIAKEGKHKLRHADSIKKSILLTTPVSWKSWGENIYIDIEVAPQNKSKVTIQSATLFQSYSWGKNEENLEKLAKSIDNSLII